MELGSDGGAPLRRSSSVMVGTVMTGPPLKGSFSSYSSIFRLLAFRRLSAAEASQR